MSTTVEELLTRLDEIVDVVEAVDHDLWVALHARLERLRRTIEAQSRLHDAHIIQSLIEEGGA